MKFPYYKGKKRTRRFSRKKSGLLIIHENGFVSYTVPARLVVSEQFFSKTALRIFLILCMKVPYSEGKKRTWRFSRKKSGSLIIHENVLKNGLF